MSDQRSTFRKIRDNDPGIHGFFIIACTFGGGMFLYKLFKFFETIKADELAGFANDPIMIYFWVAFGFLFLLAWAYMSGQFRDVEKPKFDMLRRFEEQERAEGIIKSEGDAR